MQPKSIVVDEIEVFTQAEGKAGIRFLKIKFVVCLGCILTKATASLFIFAYINPDKDHMINWFALLTRKRILAIWFSAVLFFPVTNLLLVLGVFGTQTQLIPSPWIQRYEPQGKYLASIGYESTSSWMSRTGERNYSFSERVLFLYQHGDQLILVKSESSQARTMFNQREPKPVYIGEVASTALVLARYPALEQKVKAALTKAQQQHKNLQLSPLMFYEVQQWPGNYLFATYLLPVYGQLVKEPDDAY